MPFLYMRKHQKAVLWIIVIVIVPAFCLFGVYYSRGSGSDTAGYVMGRRIPRWQFDDAYRRWFRMNKLFGRGQDLDEQQMWNRYRLVVAAELWGVRVPDKKIVEHIKTTFAQKGEFDLEAVEKILRERGRGFTLNDYEKTTREMLIQACLLGTIAGAAMVTDDEAKHMYGVEESTVSVSLIRFEAKRFKKDIIADAGEIRHFFSQQCEAYRVPEKFRFEYTGMKLKDLERDIEITDEEARKYYDDNKGLYIKSSEAKESSKESGESAEEGEEDKKEKEEYKPLEEVREDIEGVLRKQKVVGVAAERLEEIELRIDELSQTQSLQTIDLKKLADEMGLMYATTDALMIGELNYHEDLGASRDRINYLCRELEVGDPSIGVRGYTSYFVARLLEKREDYIPDFSDVEKQVKSDFIRTKAGAKALDRAKDFAELARNTSFDNVVKKQGLKTENHGPFTRLEAPWTIGRSIGELVTHIFATPVGKITEAVQCGDDVIVAKIIDQGEPDWNKFEEKKKELAFRYREVKTRSVIRQWIDSIETRFTPRKSNNTR